MMESNDDACNCGCAQAPNYAITTTAMGGSCYNSEPMPSAQVFKNKARNINIKQLDHGFIVEVGRQTFAIESVAKLVKNVQAYLENPEGMAMAWFEGKITL